MAIKKNLRIWIFALSLLGIIALTLCVAVKFYSGNVMSYLYPRIVNFGAVILCSAVALILTVAQILLLAFIIWRKKRLIVKVISIVLLLLLTTLQLYSVAISAISPYYDSYTENIDDYLIFDSAIVDIESVKDDFPEKSEIAYLQSSGVSVDYSYQFQHPILAGAEEYHISLQICFGEKDSAFDDYVSNILLNYEIAIKDSKADIILKEESIIKNEEHLTVCHGIRIDESTASVYYYATCDIDY